MSAKKSVQPRFMTLTRVRKVWTLTVYMRGDFREFTGESILEALQNYQQANRGKTK